MKFSTNGERLFGLIKNEILPLIRSNGLSWSGFDSLMAASVGGSDFGYYLKGATSIYIAKRLLHFWRHEKEHILNEASNIRIISKFIGDSVFPCLDIETRSKIARFVVSAEQSSNRQISKSIRAKYKNHNISISCYLCGISLDPAQEDESQKDFLTLEHLWPSSLGGDSVEENLLPACKCCQDHKQNYLSWEWFNVQNAVWSVVPSENEIKRIPWPTRIAKHNFEAIALADEEDLRLNESFLKLGPIVTPLQYISTHEPVTFFDLRTT